jgi:broad specificity phosphatase PhoE
MGVEVVFETHSLTEDNERGVATGWRPGRLSERGRALAAELGARRRDDGIDAVFCSDLRRAVETVELALPDHPRLLDWRLRECDYGDLNGRPAAEVHAAVRGVDEAFPNGESWREAIARVGRVLDDLPTRWDGRRVLVVGHMAAYWALEHRCAGMPIEDVGRPFTWQEGWEYALP